MCIRDRFQSHDFVHVVVFGCEHYDRNIRKLPNLLAYFGSAQFWQHNVEQNHIKFLLFRTQQRLSLIHISFLQATNPGEFDAAAYYRRKDCLFALRKTKITAQTKTYGRLEEFLSQLRYESEVLFRKLLGEKNGATASAMVLGRKKGMDSEVKALYQGAGISHLLAISGLHLSLIGAGPVSYTHLSRSARSLRLKKMKRS